MQKLGIVGLPNAGKSTVFNALTNGQAAAENYPFTTIKPNIGTVLVPDPRLEELAPLLHAERIIPAHLEFVDIAGLVKGAHKGEGLGNQFLSHIRDVSATVHVVRCFDAGDITHSEPTINPIYDIEVIHTELMLADAALLERRLEKQKKIRDPKMRGNIDKLEAMAAILADGNMLRTMEMDNDARLLADDAGLITHRREMFVANVSDSPSEQEEGWTETVKKYAADQDIPCAVVPGRLEAELAELPLDEQNLFRAELGHNESAVIQIIHAGFQLLNLITFFTAENNILQSWAVPGGTTAPEAAGEIHSDMEEGFISAEAVGARDLLRTGSMAGARSEGCLKQEGKTYEVQEGDILRIRFS